jgi:hypothetical protein
MFTNFIQTLAEILNLKIEDVIVIIVIILALVISEWGEMIKKKILQFLEQSWKT